MDQPTFADISEAEQDLDIELGPITVQEVTDAIKKLQNVEAPEDDNASVEHHGVQRTGCMDNEPEPSRGVPC